MDVQIAGVLINALGNLLNFRIHGAVDLIAAVIDQPLGGLVRHALRLCQIVGNVLDELLDKPVVDLNAGRTGHTITAAAAEITGKLLLILFDDCPKLFIHHRRIVDIAQKLIQFLFPLDAPDRLHIIKLCLISIGCSGIGDQPSGKCLHGNKAHIFLPALLYQGQLLFRRQIIKREL